MANPIAVFGSINMDLVVYSDSLPAEGETIFGNSFENFLGGKGANQAVAGSRLGSEVSFVGKIGNDLFGKRLREKLESENVDTELLEEHDGESGVAMINVVESTSQNQIIVISGANKHTQATQVSDSALSDIEILVSQMEIPSQEIEKLFIRASEKNCYRILNVAPAIELSANLFSQTDLFVVNEIELEFLAKNQIRSADLDSIKDCIDSLSLKQHQSVVVTLGSRGVYVSQNYQSEFIESHKVNAIDTTGSGDCFIGALASALLDKHNLFESAIFANKAAALSVTKKGAATSMPTSKEVLSFR